MGWLRLLLVTCGVFLVSAVSQAADDMEYNVTLTGACQYQIIMGWDNCQDKAVYTVFKGGKYTFDFLDKNKNVYRFVGKKDRQIDNSNLYSNIDTVETTVDGKTVVDPQAMGGCTTKITPSGDKFVYIDCAITNSKNLLLKFRINNITDVQRTIMR
jgi:hypothetical protein